LEQTLATHICAAPEDLGTLHARMSSASGRLGACLNQQPLSVEYNVGSRVGHGGFAHVYAATRRCDGEQVAIKVLDPVKLKAWEELDGATVPREVVALLTVKDVEGAINLLEWFVEDGVYFLVLERPPASQDLFEHIAGCQGLPEEEAVDIFTKIVRIVQELERKGILHRDIKSENVLIYSDEISSESKVKLIDFGSAVPVQDEPFSDTCGSKEMIPPEWLRERAYRGLPAAVWTLGLLLFDMLTATLAFESEEHILKGEVSIMILGLSPKCRRLVRMCLHDTPEKRPSLAQILEFLESD